MKQQEIQERNKQIALMLGYKTTWLDKIFYTWKCRFLYDWNLLIEAVDFIKNKGYRVAIQDDYCQITDNEAFYNEEIESSTRKEAVFIAVSDFAKLYNEKKL